MSKFLSTVLLAGLVLSSAGTAATIHEPSEDLVEATDQPSKALVEAIWDAMKYRNFSLCTHLAIAEFHLGVEDDLPAKLTAEFALVAQYAAQSPEDLDGPGAVRHALKQAYRNGLAPNFMALEKATADRKAAVSRITDTTQKFATSGKKAAEKRKDQLAKMGPSWKPTVMAIAALYVVWKSYRYFRPAQKSRRVSR